MRPGLRLVGERALAAAEGAGDRRPARLLLLLAHQTQTRLRRVRQENAAMAHMYTHTRSCLS